jgi:cell surface protein SprA
LKYIIPVGLSAWFITWWGQGLQHTSREYKIKHPAGKYASIPDSVWQKMKVAYQRSRSDTDTTNTKKKPPVQYNRYKPPVFVPKDRYGDPIINRGHQSRLIYGAPSNLKTTIKLLPDSAGNRFVIDENLGKTSYRPPTVLTADEIRKIQEDRERQKYWKDVAFGEKNSSTLGSKKNQVLIPPIKTPLGLIKFTTTGFLNLDFGVRSQRVRNPTLPIRQQRNTNFNFDPHLNISLTGQVGDRLKISLTQDTKSSFQFQNNFKVEYTPQEEDIIQKLDFGNVSFPLKSTLIPGAQNLFGLTTTLRFGKLFVRGVYSNQRAQADQIVLKGGAQRRNFEIRADKYEQNRHFFLSHFFRNQYETWLGGLPVITSGLNITRVEVYVTNRTNNTQTLRNIVGLLDLAENSRIKNTTVATPVGTNPAANNDANQLFDKVKSITNADAAVQQLETTLGLKSNEDFVLLRGSRKLNENEYSIHPQLGYISLNAPLKNDEVLAVSFEYTYNGQRYKVGELSEDYQDRGDDEVIYLKMLRPASIRIDLPTWDLMMKNIYSLDATQIAQENFQLRIIYKDDLTGIDNPSLQEGTRTKDIPLLQIMNLDNLNQQNDPQKDGNFDYISGVTIDPDKGKIIFPVLEPFGSSNLVRGTRADGFNPNGWFDPVTEIGLINKYVFDKLYRETQADALQEANKNKFFLAGGFEASSSSDVTLPGINIAEGSVRVTAGNTPLTEGTRTAFNLVRSATTSRKLGSTPQFIPQGTAANRLEVNFRGQKWLGII